MWHTSLCAHPKASRTFTRRTATAWPGGAACKLLAGGGPGSRATGDGTGLQPGGAALRVAASAALHSTAGSPVAPTCTTWLVKGFIKPTHVVLSVQCSAGRSGFEAHAVH